MRMRYRYQCACVFVYSLHVKTEGCTVSVLGLCLCTDSLWGLQNVSVMAASHQVQDSTETMTSALSRKHWVDICACESQLECRKWDLKNHKQSSLDLLSNAKFKVKTGSSLFRLWGRKKKSASASAYAVLCDKHEFLVTDGQNPPADRSAWMAAYELWFILSSVVVV